MCSEPVPCMHLCSPMRRNEGVCGVHTGNDRILGRHMIYIYIYMCVCVCLCIYIYVYVYVYVYVYAYEYVYTCIYAYTHTHTHTHTIMQMCIQKCGCSCTAMLTHRLFLTGLHRPHMILYSRGGMPETETVRHARHTVLTCRLHGTCRGCPRNRSVWVQGNRHGQYLGSILSLRDEPGSSHQKCKDLMTRTFSPCPSPKMYRGLRACDMCTIGAFANRRRSSRRPDCSQVQESETSIPGASGHIRLQLYHLSPVEENPSSQSGSTKDHEMKQAELFKSYLSATPRWRRERSSLWADLGLQQPYNFRIPQCIPSALGDGTQLRNPETPFLLGQQLVSDLSESTGNALPAKHRTTFFQALRLKGLAAEAWSGSSHVVPFFWRTPSDQNSWNMSQSCSYASVYQKACELGM